eukprot:757326-Hanusia_phi.AAC.1
MSAIIVLHISYLTTMPGMSLFVCSSFLLDPFHPLHVPRIVRCCFDALVNLQSRPSCCATLSLNSASVAHALSLQFIATLEQGATCIEYVATAEELEGVGGNYYAACKEAPTSEIAKSEELQSSLWSLSETMVGCDLFFYLTSPLNLNFSYTFALIRLLHFDPSHTGDALPQVSAATEDTTRRDTKIVQSASSTQWWMIVDEKSSRGLMIVCDLLAKCNQDDANT